MLARPIPCDTADVGFAFDAPVVDLTCDPEWRCRADAQFALRNCRNDSPVSVTVTIVRGPADAHGREYVFELPPGGRRRAQLTVYSAGAMEAVALFNAPGIDLAAAVLRSLHVTNSGYQRARAECVACRGVWASRGIRMVAGCACRMPDAGRSCEDGGDCQGECLPTGLRWVGRSRAPWIPTDGRRVSASPATAVRTGRCSAFPIQFGCHEYIPAGARADGPRPPSLLGVARVCVD